MCDFSFSYIYGQKNFLFSPIIELGPCIIVFFKQ